jgi:hypothetical protein
MPLRTEERKQAALFERALVYRELDGEVSENGTGFVSYFEGLGSRQVAPPWERAE